MNGVTPRDEVWDAVLFHIAYSSEVHKNGFVRSDLEIPPQIGDKTVVRVLHSMLEMGWLKKESKYANTYYPGDRLYFLASILKETS